MLLRKRKVTTEQSDNRRIRFLCNSVFINPLGKGAKRKSFQLAEVNIPKHVFKMTTQTGPQLKAVLLGKPCRGKRRLGSSLARALWVPLDIPAHPTAQTHPQPPQQQQGTQDVRAAGASRTVLAVLSTFHGMTGFSTSL